ncbi:MAG: NUDIX hydrolase [Sphingomonas bacterium]|nr:NUDIX hydrolase [Sphingomonas bacterium]
MPAERIAIRQVAALPYRIDGPEQDAVLVLLVTSRDTKRWVLPKGNMMVGIAPHRAAAREAEEEAGVCGTIARKPLGRFPYRKWRSAKRFDMTKVDVFALKVTKELVSWKEQGQRERRWFAREEAAEMVDEPELRVLIRSARLN